jgi:hypothetical protein
MHKYFYQICTCAINDKYMVRKIIYDSNNNYVFHEDNKFNSQQIDKLLKFIDISEYSIVDSDIIKKQPPNKFNNINKNENYFESKNLENFITGNFSYP